MTRCCSCCEPARQDVDITSLTEADAIKERVRSKYSSIAEGSGADYTTIVDGYEEIEGYVEEANLGLGCGLPVEYAALVEGQIVLDLGSGAGLDAFVARRIVGDTGVVVGLDFSEAMIVRAHNNAQRLGYENVHFVLGDIEAMPFHAEYADVIVSNCVLNLVPDKERAFAEMFRVLRPGGHFAISDVVHEYSLPEAERQRAEAYVGCVAGAIEREDDLAMLRKAGFQSVQAMNVRQIPEAPGALSVTVCGTRPWRRNTYPISG